MVIKIRSPSDPFLCLLLSLYWIIKTLFVFPQYLSLHPAISSHNASFPLFSRRALLRATTLMWCTQGIHKQFTSPPLLLLLSLRRGVAVLFLHTGDNDLWTSWRFKSSGKRSRKLHQSWLMWRISAHACAFPWQLNYGLLNERPWLGSLACSKAAREKLSIKLKDGMSKQFITWPTITCHLLSHLHKKTMTRTRACANWHLLINEGKNMGKGG